MKISIFSVSYLVMGLAVGCANASQSLTSVKPNGETIITASIGNLNVYTKINTHEIDIGKPSDGRPPVIQSSCTYSRYPCSIVDRIEIVVNNNSLFVPRSVYCHLADLNRAEIKSEENMVILTLFGGDASESYIVKIKFGSDDIRSAVVFSAMLPSEPLQETTYYVRSLE